MPRPRPGLRATFAAEDAAALFYNRCPPALRDAAARVLSPQPIRPLIGAIRTTAERLGRVPKHYIGCSDDRLMPPADSRGVRDNLHFETVTILDADHSPFVSAPVALADALERLMAHRSGRA